MADHVHIAGGITEMLRGWRDQAGNEADPHLLRLVYDELRRRAHHYLMRPIHMRRSTESSQRSRRRVFWLKASTPTGLV